MDQHLPPRGRRLPPASEAGRAMIAGTTPSPTLAKLQRNTTALLVTTLHLLCSTSSISASTTPARATQLNQLQTELRAAREKEKNKSLTGCFFVGHQAPDVDTVASAVVAAWMYNGVATLPASEKDLGKDVQLVLADAHAASKQANATDAGKIVSGSTGAEPLALAFITAAPAAISDEVAKRTAEGTKPRTKPCVVLVDHNEEKQRPVAVQQGLADVVAIFDHHKIDSSAAIASNMVEYMQVGSTATLLFQKMNTTYLEAVLKKEQEAAGAVAAGAAAKTNPAEENSDSAAAASSPSVAQQQHQVGEDENIIMQKERTKDLLSLIPKTILRLILYAILSDTVNLTSPTTTDVDRKTVSVINAFLSLSPNNQNKMWLEMATAKDAELAALSFDKLLEKDAKLFTAGSCNVHIGVAEFLDTATLQKILHDEGTAQLAKSMESAKKNIEKLDPKSPTFYFFFLVSIHPDRKGSTMLLPESFHEEKEILRNTFPPGKVIITQSRQENDRKSEDADKSKNKSATIETAMLPGVSSRKKQLVLLKEYVEEAIEFQEICENVKKQGQRRTSSNSHDDL
ncbi:unnamed protein product [Amoebophrya sp. A120]|nr:unnamed protein product [Amoebophrya sp. A120]|eukprot:GSA120T00023671001.1